jgi:hypothetical protein
MESQEHTPSGIILKTTIVHTVTYFVIGPLAFTVFDYSAKFADPVVAGMLRQTDHPPVSAGPLFQVIRGLLFGVVFYALRDVVLPCPLAWRRVKVGLPAGRGQLASSPLGGTGHLGLSTSAWEERLYASLGDRTFHPGWPVLLRWRSLQLGVVHDELQSCLLRPHSRPLRGKDLVCHPGIAPRCSWIRRSLQPGLTA